MKNATSRFLHEITKNHTLLIMMLPAFLMYLIFSYLPIYGITLAFKDYQFTKGILGSPWVGLKHFSMLLDDIFLTRAFRNTVLLGFYSLLWGFPAPIIFSLLLNEVKRATFKRVAQTISYFPYFISTVIIVGMMKELFAADGVVNAAVKFFGGAGINFFSKAQWFRTLYVGSGIWQGLGWGSIIYLAAIAGIDTQLYEAAIADGANRLQQMWHITLPCLIPTMRVLMLFSIAGILGTNFEKVWLMYNPSTYDTADVLSTYIYRYGIEGGGFGYGTAIGLFNSVISLMLLVIANTVSKKISGSGLW